MWPFIEARVFRQIRANSIWFLSAPAANSRSVRVTRWNSQHPVTRWVRTQDVSVRNPATLTPLPNDTVLAYAKEIRRRR